MFATLASFQSLVDFVALQLIAEAASLSEIDAFQRLTIAVL